VTVSTLTVVPEAHASGTAPYAEPIPTLLAQLARSPYADDTALERAARPDYPHWLAHVRPAAGCARPIRLHGTIDRIEVDTGRLLSTVSTADMPDGVIYKPCGNRRAAVCPSCSETYRRDVFHVMRAGLAGGDGIPDSVAHHPGVFATFTAPSFGEVHTRYVRRHTCRVRRYCDCRPEPCYARRNANRCRHGRLIACFARHGGADRRLGSPLCPDCYDYPGQAVWNIQSGELWRRTTITISRHLRRTARSLGIDPDRVKLEYGKGAEMQRRAAVHFHAVIRLDGADPADPDAILPLPPPAGLNVGDLADAIRHAATTVAFVTDPHPTRPGGWAIGWGDIDKGIDVQPISVHADGPITADDVAGYIAKYATKSTEDTGHVSARLTPQTIDIYADPDGTHTQRLVDACWRLGGPRWPLHGPTCARVCRHRSCAEIASPPAWHPTLCGPVCARTCRHRSCAEIRVATTTPAKPWQRLRLWAHQLGFGGHPFTKSRRYSVTLTVKRQQRVTWRRRTLHTGPEAESSKPPEQQDTVLVVNFLQFVGSGWHTTGDALLANTSAAMAREHQRVAREQLTELAA